MFIASRRRLLGASYPTELAERRHHDRDEDESQDHVSMPPFAYVHAQVHEIVLRNPTIRREARREAAMGRPWRMPPVMSTTLSDRGWTPGGRKVATADCETTLNCQPTG